MRSPHDKKLSGSGLMIEPLSRDSGAKKISPCLIVLGLKVELRGFLDSFFK